MVRQPKALIYKVHKCCTFAICHTWLTYLTSNNKFPLFRVLIVIQVFAHNFLHSMIAFVCVFTASTNNLLITFL